MTLVARLFTRVGTRCLSRETILLSTQTSFNSSTPSNDGATSVPFTFASLGLERNFVLPSLHSIRKLPEVEKALVSFPSLSSVEEISRAIQVFDAINGATSERLAVRALLAECYQRLAVYDKALDVIDGFDDTMTNPPPNQNLTHAAEDIVLARAKALWTSGEFDEALRLCESIIQQYNDFEESFPGTNLHMASAMTGKALCQLASMNTMDDAYSVRDYFRITSKFLERHPSTTGVPEAAALNNRGVAEAVYALFLEEHNNVSVPMQSGLKAWFQALQKLEGGKQDSTVSFELLKAKIQCNLAWGILNFERDKPDCISKAYEYAGKSLAIYDQLKTEKDDSASADHYSLGLTRTLSVLASCFHRMDNAVTSEGLFQSALDNEDMRPPDTLSLLEVKAAYKGYAKLCSKWEKRESDAKRLEENSSRVEDLLPFAWKGKCAILSSLWFWTPGDFGY